MAKVDELRDFWLTMAFFQELEGCMGVTMIFPGSFLEEMMFLAEEMLNVYTCVNTFRQFFKIISKTISDFYKDGYLQSSFYRVNRYS